MENKWISYENKLKNDLSYFAVLLDPRLNISYFKDNEKHNSFNAIKLSFINYYKKYYCIESQTPSQDNSDKKSNFKYSIHKKRKLSDDEEVNRYFEIDLEVSEIDLIQCWTIHKSFI